MKPEEVWKNFNLGQELDIAGTFIYNGLRCFHEMRALEHTDEIFEFFYNLSIGLERLLKIAHRELFLSPFAENLYALRQQLNN